MDIKIAAQNCKELIDFSTWSSHDSNLSGCHCIEMCDKIISGVISGEKAHRWLGWLQACMCVYGVAKLEDLKLINKKA